MNTPDDPTPERPTTRRYWLILPLLAAAVLAMFIAMDTRREVELAIAVSVINVDEDLLLIDTPRPTIRLRVSGTPSTLETIDTGATACRIDLGGLAAGTHTIPVQPADIKLPKGVSLEALLTPAITVNLAPVVRKTVGVVAVLAGNPAPGYAVTGISLKPDRIVLKGTAAMLDGIETARTRPIDLEGAAEGFKKEVPLNLADTIRVEPPLRIVVADIQIQERVITRVLEDVPVLAKGAATDIRIVPETITLTVSGPEAIVNTIEKDPAFSVSIDLKGLEPGTHRLKAAIHLPIQVSLNQVSPEQFSVTISH